MPVPTTELQPGAPTLVLVHTVPPLVGVFQALTAELLPGFRVFHLLDEPMLERVRRRGSLAVEDGARLAGHVDEAVSVGATAVLVTCSTVSPVVDMVRPAATIPVVKIDEAMVEEAVRRANAIGVLATAATTLEPTRQLLEEEAARQGKSITVELVLVDGARDALFAGDGETHDRLILEASRPLFSRTDVIILAQATMARAISLFGDEETAKRVLTSPHLALAQIAGLLGRSSKEQHRCE